MAEILEKLTQLTEGLTFMSETDAPIEVIDTASPTTLNEVMAYIAEYPDEVTEYNLSDFFRNATRIYEGASEEEINLANRNLALVNYLQEICGESLYVCKIGNEPQKQVYIIGHTPQRKFVLLKTYVVET